jgi:hypothetical protein
MNYLKKLTLSIIYFFKIKLIFKIVKNKNLSTLIRIADSSNYLQNNKKIKSIIFWTMHKCASTYVSKFLSMVAKEVDLKHFDYAGNIWELGNEINLKDPFLIELNCDFIYRSYGEIYGPMRTPFDFNLRSELNNIFFLRDPRDLIISKYYSIAYSHSVPSHNYSKKKFLNLREQAKKKDINTFFLEEIDNWIIPYYTKYKIMRENSELSSFYKYEDLKANPKKIFLDLSQNMNVNISEKSIENLIEIFEKPFQKKIKDKSKNIFVHTRSGKSRQFENEIDNNVLNEANKKLEDILNFWNFKI